MSSLYSPVIGIVIFLLLISALSLLVGKKRSWINGITTNKQRSSRRKRYKDTSFGDGTNLENISSIDDHLLYQRFLNDNEPINQNSELIELNQDINPTDGNIADLEIAATSEETINPSQQTKWQDVKEELVDNNLNKIDLNDIIGGINENKNMPLASEEFSDQWMEKRLQSLFEDEQKNVHSSNDNASDDVKFSNATRYDDLSESYFNQVRREKDGTKE
jgi:hypothetical protein